MSMSFDDAVKLRNKLDELRKKKSETIKVLTAQIDKLIATCPHPSGMVVHHSRGTAEGDAWDECPVCGKNVTDPGYRHS